MKTICIIPARYQSTRFPGKPLADIMGRPMIWWVYQQCKKVKAFDEIYIATDSYKIEEACQGLKIPVQLTSDKHLTGTDRVGEVARRFSADLIINVQGDEPLLEPSTIEAAIRPFYNNPELQVTNLMTKIMDPIEVVNSTVPKVITNMDGVGIYLTRATAPYPKGSIAFNYYKQVCVYGFRPDALKFFCEYGQKYGKAKVEAIEDIEILRFIENGYRVQYIEVESDTVAVDTEKDLIKVRQLIKNKNSY